MIGVLGSAVAEILAEHATVRVPLRRLGIADVFGESEMAEELLEKHRLTTTDFVAAARALIGLK